MPFSSRDTGAGMVTVTIDEKALARAIANIAKYADKPLQRRADQAYLAGARLAVRALRSAAPRGPTGNLRKSISARKNRARPGELSVATVGTRHRIAPHRYLVVEGTKPHSLAPKRAGKGNVSYIPDGAAVFGPRMGHFVTNTNMHHPGAKGNPFVTRVMADLAPRINDFIASQVLAIDGHIASSFG